MKHRRTDSLNYVVNDNRPFNEKINRIKIDRDRAAFMEEHPQIVSLPNDATTTTTSATTENGIHLMWL